MGDANKSNGNDCARHQYGRENDNVEIGDEVILGTRRTDWESRQEHETKLNETDAHLTMHAMGRMRNSDMSSTESRRSNVLNGSGNNTCTFHETVVMI